MRKTRTTRTFDLTIERSEFVFPKPRAAAFAWCARCGRSVPFVTAPEAAASAGASVRAIFRRIEAGEIHYFETPGASLLVCLDSLARFT